jgi:hypothetical protein
MFCGMARCDLYHIAVWRKCSAHSGRFSDAISEKCGLLVAAEALESQLVLLTVKCWIQFV